MNIEIPNIEQLEEGKEYIRMVGTYFTMERLIYSGWEETAFNLNWHFTNPATGKKTNLGKNEGWLFYSVEDALIYAKWHLEKEFDENLEEQRKLYVMNKLGHSVYGSINEI